MQQGTQEWLEFRRKGIGASDAPIIMGTGYGNDTKFKLYDRKIKGYEPAETYPMKHGKMLEPYAREAFIQLKGIPVKPTIEISNERPWQFASLDGYDEATNVAVELKCTLNHETHCKVDSGVIPDVYEAQLQHQMCVKALEWMYLVSYYQPKKEMQPLFAALKVYRNDSYIKNMLKEEEKFMECLMTKTPPELSQKDLVEMHDEQISNLLSEYEKLSHMQKYCEEQKDMLKENIIKMIDPEVPGIRVGSFTVKKETREGTVDYKKIPELVGVNLDKYRKRGSEYWRISSNP